MGLSAEYSLISASPGGQKLLAQVEHSPTPRQDASALPKYPSGACRPTLSDPSAHDGDRDRSTRSRIIEVLTMRRVDGPGTAAGLVLAAAPILRDGSDSKGKVNGHGYP